MSRRPTFALASFALVCGILLGTPAAAAASMPKVGGSWSAIAPLTAPAAVMTMTGGADGKLYAFGFCEGTCPQTGGSVAWGAPVTYVYNPSDSSWRPRRPAPVNCSDAKASALDADGNIRLAGCWKDLVSASGFRVAIYNPSSNTWTMAPGRGPYVDPIAGMTAADGTILWFSETLRNDGSAVFVSGHRVAIEKTDGSWRLGAQQPKDGPSDGAALGSDGNVYAAGGSRECQPEFGACAMPPVESWIQAMNAWAKPTVLPTSRIRVAVTSDARGRIFTIGGLAADASRMFSRVEVYRPNSGTWARAADLPDARFAATAAFTADGRVWVFGGYDAFGNPLSDGFVFTPA